ncbi:MAG TPA: hypothetical protein VF064_13840 [Pyrinomonadaceae bacterium]
MAVRSTKRKGEAGFSLVQMVVTLAVVAIVTTFATMRVVVARDHMRLNNAAREFAAVAEKARIDSVRRHENGGQATLFISSPTTYLVFMDHNYSGNPAWRTYSLPDGVQFANLKVTQANGTVENSAAFPVTVSFSWRGHSSTANYITFQNTHGHSSFVSITGAGEVSLDRGEISLLAGIYAAVAGDASALGPGVNPGGGTGIEGGAPPPPPTPPPSPTPSPSPEPTASPTPQPSASPTPQPSATPSAEPSATPSASPTPQPSASPTPTPEATPVPTPPCTMSLSPTRLDLHNSGNNQPQTGVVTVTFANPTANPTFTVKEVSSTEHLTISFTANKITIGAKNGGGNRGAFLVRVTPSTGCGSAQDINVNVAQ